MRPNTGADLFQELIEEGCHAVTRYQATTDKVMRLHAQTETIKKRLRCHPRDRTPARRILARDDRLSVFPKGKHDDQVDSTAQFLDWLKRPFPGQGFYEVTRIQAEAITQRTRPQPVKPNWAIGSMESQAEQKKARVALPDPECDT